MDIENWQWILVIASSAILFLVSPWAKKPNDFFRGSKNDTQPGFWMLCSSLVISWLFAKSITNAANLGQSFGFVGGVAYATYYLSFLSAGLIIYRMRVKGGFTSLHDFLSGKFGKSAIAIFSLIIGFRLLNEVWSNTMVIGSYFGEKGSGSYFLAIGVFTLLTMAYTLKGGLRSSLLTDLIQMVLFGILLFIILGVILPKTNYDVAAFVSSGEWTFAGGLNLMFVALLQLLSYPFHDPVLTDRAFIADPKVTLRSFIWATVIGSICILLFSFVGIFGQMQGLSGQAPVAVSKLLGAAVMLAMNFIMITSAASTLDSTFNAFSKLTILDLKWFPKTISNGRKVVLALTVLGTLPVLLGPDILGATTTSGTVAIGLTPIFIFWKRKSTPLAFNLSVGAGIIFGILYALEWWPDALLLSQGKYALLLSVNLIAVIVCSLLYLVGSNQQFLSKKNM